MGVIITGVVAVSCGKKGVPPDGNIKPKIFLEVVSGQDQLLPPYTLSLDSLRVRVVNGQGLPVVGDTVTFTQLTPGDSGGFFFSIPRLPDTLITNQQGYAYNLYRSDGMVGVDTLMVTTSSLGDTGAVYFIVTVRPGQAADIEKISPMSTQSSQGGKTIPVPYVVRVKDRFGNSVPNSRVVYRATERCVVITDSMLTRPFYLDTAYTFTDTTGVARANWVLTVNPDPYFGGYPNTLPELHAYAIYNNARVDSLYFQAYATNPGQLKYYYDVRPVLVDNCQGAACHGSVSSYLVDFYYTLMEDNNLIPGDTTCPFADDLDPLQHISNINMVEEDKAFRWVKVDSAAPGSSGLNSYSGQMKTIFDGSCVTCHNGTTLDGSYDMSDHPGIRGDGSDMSIPNAIPGDSSCLLVTYMLSGHYADSLSLNPDTAAALADSIVRWVVTDSLREY
jgi:hypothetical protein